MSGQAIPISGSMQIFSDIRKMKKEELESTHVY